MAPNLPASGPPPTDDNKKSTLESIGERLDQVFLTYNRTIELLNETGDTEGLARICDITEKFSADLRETVGKEDYEPGSIQAELFKLNYQIERIRLDDLLRKDRAEQPLGESEIETRLNAHAAIMGYLIDLTLLISRPPAAHQSLESGGEISVEGSIPARTSYYLSKSIEHKLGEFFEYFERFIDHYRPYVEIWARGEDRESLDAIKQLDQLRESADSLDMVRKIRNSAQHGNYTHEDIQAIKLLIDKAYTLNAIVVKDWAHLVSTLKTHPDLGLLP